MIKLQRAARRKLVAVKQTDYRAASKLQAAFRGAILRRQLDLSSVVRMAREGEAWERELDNTGGGADSAAAAAARPGMNWLEKSMGESLKRERLERARDALTERRRARFSVAETASLRKAAAAIDGTRLKDDKRTTSFGKAEKRLTKRVEQRALSFAPPRLLRAQTTKAVTFSMQHAAARRNRGTSTHDNHLYDVGILYSRANPKSKDQAALRDSITRLRTRSAKTALPRFAPPSVPADISATFSDVVFQAQRLARVLDERPQMDARLTPQKVARQQEIKEELNKKVETLQRQELAVRSLPIHMPSKRSRAPKIDPAAESPVAPPAEVPPPREKKRTLMSILTKRRRSKKKLGKVPPGLPPVLFDEGDEDKKLTIVM